MKISDFQKYCASIVKDIDTKRNVDRTPQLSFTQFVEEVGELARDVNSPALRGKSYDPENIKGEFADVFLQFCILADMHGVDLEEAVAMKVEILKQRHGL